VRDLEGERVKRFVLLAVLLVGCGSEAPKRAASTPSPSPSPSPTVTPTPTREPRSDDNTLRTYLTSITSSAGGACVQADEPPASGLAWVKCDYDGASEGSFVLFKSLGAMYAYYNTVSRHTKPIRGSDCSGFSVWHRKALRRTQGRVSFGRVGSRKVLVWTDDHHHVVGTITARGAKNDEICAIWRKRD
jgi:hypothetical protein